MNSKIELLKDSLSQTIGEPITSAQCKVGSMLVLDFGQLLSIDVKTEQGLRSFFQGKLSLWSLLAEWEIRQSGKVSCNSQSQQAQIQNVLDALVGGKLRVWNVTEKLDLTLAFDNGYTLSFSSKGKKGEALWVMAVRDLGEFIAEHSELTYKKKA